LPNGPQLEAERGTVADQTLDLLGEMTRDDEDAHHTCDTELPQQRRNHRSAVDRQHGFRPPLRERT